MCGITGAVWSVPDLEIGPETLQQMTTVLAHRGPDDQGQYRSDICHRPPYDDIPGVALGFRRLAVIDVAGGHQPMTNEDRSVWVVFNGEIYNYPALRNRLEGNGHQFRSHSDTETLVHLYEDEGVDCFRHLNGMFAAAIWDARNNRLVLGRDRLGQKPLVFSHESGRLSFASELKSLLEMPGFEPDLDPGAVDEYLTYQYVPHPNTIYRNIHKLAPGHFAIYENGNLTTRPYWEVPREPLDISPVDAVQQVREFLTSSVKLRMQSDVPLGAFLSGGVDSSLITALMMRLGDRTVQTFSIGFPESEYDESDYAQQVASFLQTDHHHFRFEESVPDLLEQLVWQFDEPFADSSAIPTWYLAKQTREHVTVALSGDGGDELFAGYDRYRAAALAATLDSLEPVRWCLGHPLWQKLPGSRQRSWTRRFRRFSEAVRMAPARRYAQWVEIFHEQQRASIYNGDFIQSLPKSDPFGFLETNWAKFADRDPVTTTSMVDLVTYLPCDLMTKVDIASMSHGLECRQPFLDYRLVELAACIPRGLTYRWGRGKRLLRMTFAELIPAQIWKRKKMGFGVPLGPWFRGSLRELVQDTLLADDAKSRRFLRPESIQAMWDQHHRGEFDHAYRLWTLLFLELWMRRWRV